MRVRLAVWVMTIAVCGIDQLTKWWAIESLGDGHSISIIGSHLRLSLVYNKGAALSILGEYTLAITAFMIIVMAVLVWFHGRAAGFYGIAVFGLALGGAFGNIIDRFFRGEGLGRGPVVDMIDYGGFFIGNVADIAIVFAAALTIASGWTSTPVLRPRVPEVQGELGVVPR